MMTRIGSLAVSGALILLPPVVRAEQETLTGDAAADAAVESAQPALPAPSEPPPAPPAVQPPPPQPAPSEAAVPSGQWVYTSQYGWIWMPYSSDYSSVPSDGWGEPYLYVYYPAWGWCWIGAPWVWGVGPWPWFGPVGPRHFYWYTTGWWRQPWRWHYTPAVRAPLGVRRAPIAVPGGRLGPVPERYRGDVRGGAPVYRSAPLRGAPRGGEAGGRAGRER
jgi:hypothetical protein